MKNIIFLIAVLSLPMSTFAQIADSSASKVKENSPIKSAMFPVKSDIGISFDLTGMISAISLNAMPDLSGNQSLLLRYYTDNDKAFRMGFGVSSTSLQFSTVDSVGAQLVAKDSTFKVATFYVAPGIEKHLEGSDRLDPYIGFNLLLGIIGKTSAHSTTTTTDTLGVGTYEIDHRMAGGQTIGFTATIGFNYFVAKRLSVGAEYSLGYRHSSYGGDWATVYIDSPSVGSPTTDRIIGSEYNAQNGLNISSTAGITLSYFFGM